LNLHRSSYKYWQKSDIIELDFTILSSDVKAVHLISNGSAGAITAAKLVYDRGGNRLIFSKTVG
jgi:hypothetical protein